MALPLGTAQKTGGKKKAPKKGAKKSTKKGSSYRSKSKR